MRYDDGATQPECEKTLKYQMDMLLNGIRNVVMVPKGTKDMLFETAKKFQLGSVDNPAGRFYFNPDLVYSDYIQRCYERDEIGILLGYGIPRKPEIYSATVVVRDRNGVEKHAVITDRFYAKAVLDRAYEIAGCGDTVTIEKPDDVVEKRRKVWVA